MSSLRLIWFHFDSGMHDVQVTQFVVCAAALVYMAAACNWPLSMDRAPVTCPADPSVAAATPVPMLAPAPAPAHEGPAPAPGHGSA